MNMYRGEAGDLLLPVVTKGNRSTTPAVRLMRLQKSTCILLKLAFLNLNGENIRIVRVYNIGKH